MSVVIPNGYTRLVLGANVRYREVCIRLFDSFAGIFRARFPVPEGVFGFPFDLPFDFPLPLPLLPLTWFRGISSVSDGDGLNAL